MGDHRPVIVFDGDDTLWWTEPLYDRARSRAAEVVAAHGLDADLWDEAQRQQDIVNVEVMGYSAERFPTSSVQALDLVARLTGTPVTDELRRAVRAASQTVFRDAPQVVPDAAGVLRAITKRFDAVLLTTGDKAVQHHRLEQSGLRRFFSAVNVVPSKSETLFRRLVERRSNGSWSVGNNVASDIVPALDAGADGVWVDAYVWGYERARMAAALDALDAATEARVVRADTLSEVPDIVGSR